MKHTTILLAAAAALFPAVVEGRRHHNPLRHIARLIPALLADHDSDDMKYMEPTNEGTLYDAGAADSTVHIVNEDLIFSGKTVCIEQTNYIDSVVCDKVERSMTIWFNNVTAYDYARKTWPQNTENNDADDFYLISLSKGCSDDPKHVAGQRTYSRILDMRFYHMGDIRVKKTGKMIARAHYRDVGFAGAIKSGEITWGTKDKNRTVTRSGGVPKHDTQHRWISKRGKDLNAVSEELKVVGAADKCHKDSKFDRRLDDRLRKVALTDEEMTSKALPHLGVELMATSDMRKRHVREAFAELIHSITTKVKEVTEMVGEEIEEHFGPLWHRIEEKFLDRFVGPHSKKTFEGNETNYNFLDQTIPFNFPKNTIVTPFKDSNGKAMNGILVVDGSIADIWCVECGAKGEVNIHGKIKFSLHDGVSEASIAVAGDLIVAAQLGIDAHGAMELPLKKTLFKAPFGPGIEIPGVVTFAPTLNFALNGHLGVEARAQFRAGSGLIWNNTYIKLDLTGNNNDASGWKPEVMPMQFDASGDVKAYADVAVKASVGGELSFLKFQWLLGLAAEPTLQIRAERKLQVNGTLPIGPSGGDDNPGDGGQMACTNGLWVDMNFITKVYGQAPLIKDKWWIYNSTHKIADDKCVPIPSINEKTKTITSGDGPLPDGPVPVAPGVPVPPQKIQARTPTIVRRAQAVQSPQPEALKLNDVIIQDRWDRTFVSTDKYGAAIVESHERACTKPAKFLSAPNSNVIAADSDGRFWHVYINEMKAHGISRLRLHDGSAMPENAEVVALWFTPKNGYLVAMKPGDKKGYSVVACRSKGQPTKLFLAEDLEKAEEKMRSRNVANAIVGGEVTGCSIKTFEMVML